MRRRATTCAGIAAWLVLLASGASSTVRYGDIQISGNVETQELFRIDRSPSSQLNHFDLIQQRNTLRLQYEQLIVKNGTLAGFRVPFMREASFFAYYRGVYDSAYDLAPGPGRRVNDGSPGGGFRSIRGSERADIAFEDVLREVYVDVDTTSALSFRIGRQQINWGNSLNFRATDSVNAIDGTWHLQQEAGVLGKTGFSEIRVPALAIKALYNVGDLGGVLSGVFMEVYDIPFDFQPTKIRFSPAPFSLPYRNPFRAGLVLNGAPLLGLPGSFPVQPCFDLTGNTAPNAQADADFSSAATTGLCNSRGRPTSKLSQGLYDRHDPGDVNQVGARVGGSTPFGLNLALSYLYRRHLVDATGGTPLKQQLGVALGNPLAFAVPAIHSTTDPLTRRTSTAFAYARVPVEIYYPYVSVFGLDADYFDELTATVYNLEIAATHGAPITSASLTGDGVRRTDVLEGSLLLDRPTWIRFLNSRATWSIFVQANVSYVPDHQALRLDAGGRPLAGDLGPVANLVPIPGLFRDKPGLDERRRFEPLTVVAATSFYRGGSLVPLFLWLSDWNHAPAMEFATIWQFLPTPSIILEPGIRVFWTNGRAVDDRYLIGALAGRSEIQMKATYQF